MSTLRGAARRLVEHETLYFPDGDVALSLEDTDGDGPFLRMYRVDKIYLTRHSPIFSGLFSLPSVSHVEIYNGVPIVGLTGDNPVALEEVLRFIYYPACVPSPSCLVLTFDSDARSGRYCLKIAMSTRQCVLCGC